MLRIWTWCAAWLGNLEVLLHITAHVESQEPCWLNTSWETAFYNFNVAQSSWRQPLHDIACKKIWHDPDDLCTNYLYLLTMTEFSWLEKLRAIFFSNTLNPFIAQQECGLWLSCYCQTNQGVLIIWLGTSVKVCLLEEMV